MQLPAEVDQRERVTVAFIVPSMIFGGAERQALTVLRNLDRTRFRPVLIALHESGGFYDEARDAGIECHYLGMRNRLSPVGLLRLVRALKSYEVRIVVTRGFSANTIGRIAALAASVPVIVVAEHSTGSVKRRGPLKRGADRILSRWTTLYLAVARSQCDYLVAEKGAPPDRIHVIHNGIDPAAMHYGVSSEARAELGIPETAFVVGIVAVLRPEKDHGTFVEAALLLSRLVPNAWFVIVGDGPESTAVRNAVLESGIEDRFVMTGLRDDVGRILPAFDVFSMASHTETFPVAALEAMGAGVPVVATRVGGLPEMVRDGEDGLLVSPHCPEDLAAAWRRLHDDEDLRRAMGSAAKYRVHRHFTVDAMVQEHERVFDTLLGGSTSLSSSEESSSA